MRRSHLYAVGDLRFEYVAVPEPGAGEALVRVAVCGVCGTDSTEFDRGLLAVPPVTLGHEFTGVVEAVGPEADAGLVGRTVVCGAGISCGRCKPCRTGRTNLCRNYRTVGLHIDGGLAGYAVVPAQTLLDVTDTGLAADTLGLAQPMAIAVHAVRRSGLRAGQDAVIIGVGGIGAFIAVAASATGARVLAVDRSEERLDLARRLGATETLLASDDTLADRLGELGWEADVFFEVSGSRSGWESVLDAALPGAVIVPVGIQKEEVSVPLGSWTLREYTIVGTVAHVIATDLPEAVRLLGSREDWSDVAHTVIPLDRLLEDGLAPLSQSATVQVKTLVDPWISAARPAVHSVSGGSAVTE